VGKDGTERKGKRKGRQVGQDRTEREEERRQTGQDCGGKGLNMKRKGKVGRKERNAVAKRKY
jgi:hypothetical protein